MLVSSQSDPSMTDFATKEYIPQDNSSRDHDNDNITSRGKILGEKSSIQFGINRRLTKIDSSIPQDSLIVEKSKIGDINVEPGSFNFM